MYGRIFRFPGVLRLPCVRWCLYASRLRCIVRNGCWAWFGGAGRFWGVVGSRGTSGFWGAIRRRDAFLGRLLVVESRRRDQPGVFPVTGLFFLTLGKGGQFHQAEFYQQAVVLAGFVIQVALVGQVQGGEQEIPAAMACLLQVALADAFACFQQGNRFFAGADHQIPEMGSQTVDVVVPLKALGQDFVEIDKQPGDIAFQDMVGAFKIDIHIQHVQVFRYRFSGEVLTGKAHHPVEDGKGIPHGPVGFLGDHVQGFLVRFNSLLFRDIFQVGRSIPHGNPPEIEDLAAREDGRDNFVLFGGGQDKDRVPGWFLQGFQEGIEGRLGKHMHLIDDVNLVFSHLGRDPYLVDEVPDIVYRVVGGRVEFKDVKGKILPVLLLSVFVDFFRQYPGAGSFTYPAGPAEEQGLSQVVVFDGVQQRTGNGLLAHHVLELLGSVLPG